MGDTNKVSVQSNQVMFKMIVVFFQNMLLTNSVGMSETREINSVRITELEEFQHK